MQLLLPKLVKEPIPKGFWTWGHVFTVNLPLLHLEYTGVHCLVTTGKTVAFRGQKQVVSLNGSSVQIRNTVHLCRSGKTLL